MSRSNDTLQDEQRPAFNEPWQVEAFALVQVLIETGRISPKEWAALFGDALRGAAIDGKPDNGETYYAALSKALEHVLVVAGLVQDAEVEQRTDDWRAAYHRTPHGKPVKLEMP